MSTPTPSFYNPRNGYCLNVGPTRSIQPLTPYVRASLARRNAVRGRKSEDRRLKGPVSRPETSVLLAERTATEGVCPSTPDTISSSGCGDAAKDDTPFEGQHSDDYLVDEAGSTVDGAPVDIFKAADEETRSIEDYEDAELSFQHLFAGDVEKDDSDSDSGSLYSVQDELVTARTAVQASFPVLAPSSADEVMGCAEYVVYGHTQHSFAIQEPQVAVVGSSSTASVDFATVPAPVEEFHIPRTVTLPHCAWKKITDVRIVISICLRVLTVSFAGSSV